MNLADDAVLCDLMVKAGFKKVFLGIETPMAESLAECGKQQNRKRDMGESVRILQRAGLEVMGGFIVGFDSDPRDIFRRQFEFIQQSGVVTAMVGLLNALPQTRRPSCTGGWRARAAFSPRPAATIPTPRSTSSRVWIASS